MKKGKKWFIGCLSLFIVVIAIILYHIITVIQVNRRGPIEWANYHSGLSIPNDTKVLKYNKHNTITGDCWTHVMLSLTDMQMNDLVAEAITKNYKKLPVSKNEGVRIETSIGEKYKQDSVCGFYYNIFDKPNGYSKVIILDTNENIMIVDFNCYK